jgi:RNA polymerase sigma-70 factor (ECF subfamily)
LENITHIIKGCIAREHKHQKTVYEHYRGYALKIVFRYIYRYEKAVDVMNEGFVKLFNAFERFEPGEEEDNEKILMAWLKKIMINTAIDELRRNSMLPEIGGIPDHVWDITDRNNDADRLLLYKDLVVLIKELPPVYRSVFNLYVIDGYTHSEIADIMGIPIGTSKSSLSRARSMLQESIKKMEDAKLCRI